MAATAIVFDLEFTSWAGALQGRWLAPGQFKEIVQIGAVRLDAGSLDELAAFNFLVRPRFNPELSDYLVQLTGITNARLAAEGVDFVPAYRAFLDFCADGQVCAFGRDDLVIAENLLLYGLSAEQPLRHYFNIAEWLRANGIETRGRHACDVGPLCGVDFAGQRHDALADARSVAAGIQALVRRGAENPFARRRT
ncbi:MAG: exonuclease domain-containing protein [Alphaproteobacteria bacterium]|nr:exonuclease domain-containing protein [Alphaproteobacteria bacterium]